MTARPRKARKSQPTQPFADRLVLFDWLVSKLGLPRGKSESSIQVLRVVVESQAEGLDGEGKHYFHYALKGAANRDDSSITADDLDRYEESIASVTKRLNEQRQFATAAAGSAIVEVRWKYFQWWALLFVEIYLERYFTDPDGLRDELNTYIGEFNSSHAEVGRIKAYPADKPAWQALNTVAVWAATGAGKTLLMHANLLQFRNHLSTAGPDHGLRDVDNTILLTTNEGLSGQHLREMRAAGISADLYRKEGRLRLPEDVQIIDINKLRDTSGDVTVDVAAFEHRNLLLVDEGHRGVASAKGKWFERRASLASAGFTFEYSATFGQAVARDAAMSDTYAKQILFDYSYRHFHADGYGKDYSIYNIEDDGTGQQQFEYLTGALLTFFQQRFLFRTHGDEWADQNLSAPLFVWVGSKVQQTASKDDISDVRRIVEFLQTFLQDREQAVTAIEKLVTNGLVTASEHTLFKDQFPAFDELAQEDGASSRSSTLYEAIRQDVFGGGHGGLTVRDVKRAPGEITLHVGDQGAPFGLIYVGDSKTLFENLKDVAGIGVSDDSISDDFFPTVNDDDSPISMLIGAKKFTEGWDCPRVSCMGLMHVGTGEGTQIIQLFGRGVRLKGRNLSLKRSTMDPAVLGPKPQHLALLETLGVFGVRANYMARFKEYLKREGEPTDEIVRIDILIQIDIPADVALPTIELDSAVRVPGGTDKDAFVAHGPSVTYPPQALAPGQHVDIDWYPRIRVERGGALDSGTKDCHDCFTSSQVDRIDLAALWFNLERFRKDRGYINLLIAPQTIAEHLRRAGWATVFMPAGERENAPAELLQQIAEAACRKHLTRVYRSAQRAWERKHRVLATLTDTGNPNFLRRAGDQGGVGTGGPQLRVSVPIANSRLEARLRAALADGKSTVDVDGVDLWWPGIHLYRPLISADQSPTGFAVVPTALNKGEERFIKALEKFAAGDRSETADQIMQGRQIFLLRNQPKSGIGFGGFYPDFMLWVTGQGETHLAFVDPKGLALVDTKSAIFDLHREIDSQLVPKQRLVAPDAKLHTYLVTATSKSKILEKHYRPEGEHPATPDDAARRILREKGVLFQDDDRYIESMVLDMLHMPPPPDSSKPDVFVSYSSKQVEFAKSVVEALRNSHGIEAWFAPERIPGSAYYAAAIEDGIQHCEVLAVLFTEESAASVHVRDEIAFAKPRVRAILPIGLGNFTQDDLPEGTGLNLQTGASRQWKQAPLDSPGAAASEIAKLFENSD